MEHGLFEGDYIGVTYDSNGIRGKNTESRG